MSHLYSHTIIFKVSNPYFSEDLQLKNSDAIYKRETSIVRCLRLSNYYNHNGYLSLLLEHATEHCQILIAKKNENLLTPIL